MKKSISQKYICYIFSFIHIGLGFIWFHSAMFKGQMWTNPIQAFIELFTSIFLLAMGLMMFTESG